MRGFSRLSKYCPVKKLVYESFQILRLSPNQSTCFEFSIAETICRQFGSELKGEKKKKVKQMERVTGYLNLRIKQGGVTRVNRCIQWGERNSSNKTPHFIERKYIIAITAGERGEEKTCLRAQRVKTKARKLTSDS
ncbi:hypothetical protein CEXT_261031 [Caerostris extrusa]|uniref:Uncharacterized protein n=1 Tax=Caerostris extrusa TaxID=172846 RepID=A0AAV4XVW9_CAEEX|nr:hypothetical protein CEXT_261031 [Caerostris extrusa]